MFYSNQIPGRTVLINEEQWLYFSGTGYLGMAHDPFFLSALAEGFQLFGTHFGGSRLSNLRFPVFEEAEAALSQWTGAAAALSVSSGSLAGQLLVRLLSDSHTIWAAPGVHPALGAGQKRWTASFEEWTTAVCLAARQSNNPMALLTSSIDPLRVQATDFSWISQLEGSIPMVLVVDDSHGFGLMGKSGGGIYTQLNPPDNVELLVISSLGKALGLPGGFIAGSRQRIGQLWQSPLFGGASPMSPAFLYAFLQCRELYAQKRAILLERIEQFANSFRHSGLFSYLPAYPVFYTDENHLASYLSRHHILISSFAYPTAHDPLITRIVLNSLHTTSDLDTMIKLVSEFMYQTRTT